MKNREGIKRKVAAYLIRYKRLKRQDGKKLFNTLDLHKYIGFLIDGGWKIDRDSVYNRDGKPTRVYVLKSYPKV